MISFELIISYKIKNPTTSKYFALKHIEIIIDSN